MKKAICTFLAGLIVMSGLAYAGKHVNPDTVTLYLIEMVLDAKTGKEIKARTVSGPYIGTTACITAQLHHEPMVQVHKEDGTVSVIECAIDNELADAIDDGEPKVAT